MGKRPKNLRTPYSAYEYRQVTKENEELTHVGPNTPCGEYLRRFWQPVGASSELKDLPLRIRVMEEDLVLFRDRSGRVGLLQLHCSHRGTSLEYGIISECGIRCCYHGWLYDVDGRILETPGEPADSTLKNKLWHGAYPVHEYGGLIFAYMGPPDKKPEFPIYDMYSMTGYKLVVGEKRIWPCNWLQIKDNSMDPVHTSFLHTITSGAQFTEEYGIVPEIEFQETPIGMVYIAVRRIGDFVWVAANDLILPNVHQVHPGLDAGEAVEERHFVRPMMIVWTVPIDNSSTALFRFRYVNETGKFGPKRVRAGGFGQDGNRSYEEGQRIPGDYEAQVSQRPIAIHDLEHLGTTDRGIIMFRKLLRKGIQDIRNGRDSKKLMRDSATKVITTFAQDTILRIPPAPTPEEDRRLLRETGKKVIGEQLIAAQ